MTPQELAKVSILIARQLGLSSSNQEKFVVEVARQVLFGDVPVAAKETVEEAVPPEPVSTPIKTEPPSKTKKRVRAMVKAAHVFEEKEKKREDKKEVKILCKSGHRCECSVCGKPLYQVTTDVKDKMPAENFAACFTPIDHKKPIPIPTRIRAIDGCVMTDCPVCGGDMTLVLWGRKPEKDFEDNGVSSTWRFPVSGMEVI